MTKQSDAQRLADEIELDGGIERFMYGKGLAESSRVNNMIITALRASSDDALLREVERRLNSIRLYPELTSKIRVYLSQPSAEPQHGGRPMTLRECMEAEQPSAGAEQDATFHCKWHGDYIVNKSGRCPYCNTAEVAQARDSQ